MSHARRVPDDRLGHPNARGIAGKVPEALENSRGVTDVRPPFSTTLHQALRSRWPKLEKTPRTGTTLDRVERSVVLDAWFADKSPTDPRSWPRLDVRGRPLGVLCGFT